MPKVPTIGFVGLGNMGSVLAANLVASGHDVVTHDVQGDGRSPDGASFAVDVPDVARRAEVIVCCLPDATASDAVIRAVAATDGRRTGHLVETSTIGVDAARANDSVLTAAGVAYVDAAVSGGVAGAKARTLSVMYAGPQPACDVVEPVLAGLSDRRRRVGDRPGLAQALKLANNFLSAMALAATSEAVAFGTSVGLDMETMIDVLNTSSGQSQATTDKFANHVLTGRYAAGFTNSLMCKDLQLYLAAAETEGSPTLLGEVAALVWERFSEADPGVDFTRIYPFIRGD